ncbi:Retrovirus-related Pol polyprotein from transposon opus, partial [Mucuna pruriens]
MVALFHDMMHKEVEVYINDMIAKSKTDRDHGIEVDPDKVKVILEMKPPQTEKEKKEWDQDYQKAFEKIKSYLKDPPVLVSLVDGRPFIMYLTVLEESMGYVLGQHDESRKKEQAIYYLSKKFIECELRYSTVERMRCALSWAAQRLRSCMLSHTTWLISKIDPIKYIFEKPALTGKVTRWKVVLFEYDIIHVTQKAIKGSVLANYLAYSPLVEYQLMKHDFPDEDIFSLTDKEEQGEGWILLFDRASNALGYGIGVVLISPQGRCFPFTTRLGFSCTNNMAEYEACAMGSHGFRLRGKWETRDVKLAPYHSYIKELTEHFESITFHHTPQEDNQMADALAILASIFEIDRESDTIILHIKHQSVPSYFQALEEETDGKPWYHDIKEYMKSKEYPNGAIENNKQSLRRMAGGYMLNGKILYQRSPYLTLLRCVDNKEAKEILEEIHEGVFDTHASGPNMARKILRAGYY